MSAAPASSSSTNGAVSSKESSGISSTDVGWQFVPQYYNFVNKHPQRLHCFYTKHSTFIHGTEGEDGTPSSGQQDIHQKILSIGFKDCKVFIHSVDSQPSANGGIIIQVIGEMFNDEGPWRKFVQTFFLAEQPNGYFVLNDIFRFLKDDTINDDDETAASETEAAAPVEQAKETAPAAAAPEPTKPVEAATPAPTAAVEEKKEATPAAAEPTPAPVEEKKAAVPEAKKEAAMPVAETPIEEKTNEPAAEIESANPVVETTPAPAADDKPAAPAAAAPTPAPAAPKAAAPPAAASAPPAPTGLPAPKTWASLAKAGTGGWGNHLAASQGVSSAAKEAAAPAAAKESAAPKEGGAPANGRPVGGRHPAAEAAMSVTTAQCFVKLANWAADRDAPVDTDLLKSVLENRFGRVKELEIVKQKACAFLEFHTVEAARKAILASLPVNQGGEGGVKVEEGRVMVEVRKEKSERGNAPGGQGPRPPRPNQGDRTESGSGAPRGGGGGGRGRGGEGRGGAGGGRGGPRGGRGGGGGPGGAPAPKQ